MRLRRYLVAGLLIWLPVGVTILVFKVMLDLIDRVLLLIPYAYRPETLLGFRIPGLGAILAFMVLLATGILAANLLGRRMVVWYESLLGRIPLVRTVYGGVKNFAAVIFSDSGSSFKKVVLIEYPRRGIYRIALQTSEDVREIQAVTNRDMVTVFVPTTPNATSGFIVFVPRDEIVELAMSVEDALKLIISLGVVVPEWHPIHPEQPLARSKASS
ncbi:MAG TPA: DUF502 domain-containing protein [Gammaproteobacteria bacterium]|nr:DUF502 domain-containing protein [Gammaproteobacteria bacterium]